jgi:hypothetical protein
MELSFKPQFRMIQCVNTLPFIPSKREMSYEEKIIFYREKYNPIKPKRNMREPDNTFRRIQLPFFMT